MSESRSNLARAALKSFFVQALLWRGVKPTDRRDSERVRRHGVQPEIPNWETLVKESQSCSIAGMLLVGRLAEQAAGKLLYYDYAKQSPVMLDMFRFCKSVNLTCPTSL